MGERRGTKALELWCRRMTEGYPGVKIDNMTTSWRDGLAFCAMIHHFRPDLIEFDKLNKEDVYYNNELAFTTAEKYLGIPALLDADDMANYEVPDRLSILTYLSQYYQVFAAQDSPNRLKRPSSSAEKSPISKPAGPPSKMAHVVGVPRRDPCQKCKLPVFLAERLTVGKKVFHRTCLKCARCGSQLAIGSFYETEDDDVFCCETCPDEEEFEDNLNNGSSIDSSSTNSAVLRHKDKEENTISSKPVRSSIADRLAFFEQNKSNDPKNGTNSKLLEKSVSDEEKTKGFNQNIATTSSYKRNAALTNFLNDTIDGGDADLETESADSSELSLSLEGGTKAQLATSTESSDSDDGEETERVECITDLRYSPTPELPKSQPPMLDPYISRTQSNEEPQKSFTATAELQLSTSIIGDGQINKQKLDEGVAIAEDHPNKNQLEPAEMTNSIQAIEAHKSQTHKSDKFLDLSATNLNESVTKDRNTDATQTPKGNVDVDFGDEGEPNDRDDAIVELRRKSPENVDENRHLEDKATTERLSVVRARLQQFEEISNNNININSNISNLKSLSPEKENLIQNDTNEHNKLDVDVDVSIDVDKCIETDTTKASNTLEDTNKNEVSTKNEMPKSIQREIANDEATIEIAVMPKASPRHVPSIQMETKDDNEVSNEIEAQDRIKKDEKEEAERSTESTTPAKPNLISSPSKTPSKGKTIDYPEDLDPFKSDQDDDGDDDDNRKSEAAKTESFASPVKTPFKRNTDEYPADLDPFKSDDDDDINDNSEVANKENRASSCYSISKKSEKSENSNPFDSSDDEIELEKSSNMIKMNSVGKIPPPRPPPPRLSYNPIDEDDNGDSNFSRHSSANSSAKKRTPVPTPRTNLAQSQNPTPEATPRLSNKTSTPHSLGLHNSSDYYGSVNSLGSTTPLHRNSDIRGSNNSITYSSGGTVRSRKSRKAPAPPQPPTVKELFPSTETLGSSKTSTPSSSTVGSPKSLRKKRPAPAPPKPSRLESNILPQITHDHQINGSGSKNLHSYPLQSGSQSKLSDEEKALLEGKTEITSVVLRNKSNEYQTPDQKLSAVSRRNSRRLIPLDATLLKDAAENAHEAQCDDQKQQLIDQEEQIVVYRRVIMPTSLNTPTHERNPSGSQDRQSEKLKDNKEAQNRNRQSQQSVSSGAEDADTTIYNKSSHGKWKRRKGPAPALPVPPRKVLQMLPLQEIRHELDIIEVQQQGLEKQGVVLEKMIRDRCEGQCGELLNAAGAPQLSATGAGDGVDHNEGGVQNSKEVEDLILQLFELVNEKNELFRRQAELMYLRRQHRLEQEQADLEYEIRVLMAQPERNKTDSDKAREEALIARLVKVVQLRNEVIECLEMDRLREAEEDMSIKMRLEQHSAKRNGVQADEAGKKNSSKLSKKEKKKQKEAKKLSKNKKIDADKDADESELATDKQKLKKKRRKFLF